MNPKNHCLSSAYTLKYVTKHSKIYFDTLKLNINKTTVNNKFIQIKKPKYLLCVLIEFNSNQ